MDAFRSAAVALGLLLFAGCLQDTAKPQPTAVYADAQDKFSNHVSGAEDASKEFTVAPAKGKLTVLAKYAVSGSGSFELVDPLGTVRHRDEIAGDKKSNDTKWAEITNPPSGVWHLKLVISGSGDYIFGIYVTGEGPPPPPPLYQDAKVRAANQVSGANVEEKKFDVPPGTPRITVKAAYHVEGAATFTLRDPALTKQNDGISGSKEFKDAVWYELDNPVPGPWRLSLDVSGNADYTFGVYY